mmetsp:Transcript_70980/g.208019  ORF Transcript_70980/g.208019 Transcript_70980/m.208019 type:complete len:217 (+) Transcript_70980:1128-1778(+)
MLDHGPLHCARALRVFGRQRRRGRPLPNHLTGILVPSVPEGIGRLARSTRGRNEALPNGIPELSFQGRKHPRVRRASGDFHDDWRARWHQDNNPVESPQELQLVQRHDDAAAVTRVGLQGREDRSTASCIHRAEGIVRHQHRRPGEQCARQRQALRLPARERHAALAHLCEESAQALDVGLQCRRADCRRDVAGPSHGYVAPQGAAEDEGALGHEA